MKKTLVAMVWTIALAGVVSCSKSNNSSNPSSNGGSNTNAVSIANMSFSPSAIVVTAGTTVTWTNNDNVSHTVTADDNSFNSGTMGNGATFTHTFSTTGTFTYHCAFHSGMTGKVTVN